ncbi:unnamed protein product [Vicia faba]|uniref:Uncharacterized protein n=1 Tax=Vicia faba TaxID=3906 RepID=A0AAV1AX42_VICFA|nr:unnamed protein product [Vicia faba]
MAYADDQNAENYAETLDQSLIRYGSLCILVNYKESIVLGLHERNSRVLLSIHIQNNILHSFIINNLKASKPYVSRFLLSTHIHFESCTTYLEQKDGFMAEQFPPPSSLLNTVSVSLSIWGEPVNKSTFISLTRELVNKSEFISLTRGGCVSAATVYYSAAEFINQNSYP